MTIFRKLPAHETTLAIVVIAAYFVLNASSGGALFTQAAFVGVMGYLTLSILIGLSQMAALAVGQLNLAVGPMGGTACAAAAVAMTTLGIPVWLTLIGVVVLAVLIGVIHGLIVNFTGLNSFIVTLATMTMLVGVQYGLVGTSTVSDYAPGLKHFSSYHLFGVPYIFVIILIFAFAMSSFFRRTPAGRRLLAVGANADGARLLGISRNRAVLLAHALSGLCVGIAAVVVLTSASGINRSVGGDWLLLSFAAPIIGGIALSGGKAPVLGTALAAALLRLIDVARSTYSLDPAWGNFVIGAAVLGTVALSTWRTQGSKRKVIAT